MARQIDMDRDDERRRLEHCRGGDASAFEELVRGSIDGLYRVAWRFTGSAHEAEDMVQEAYFRAYRALGRFQGESSFRTWVTRILINVCKDHLARRKARPTDEMDEQTTHIPDRTESPLDGAVRAEMRRKMDAAFQRLPADERAVAVLILVDGQSYSQAAKSLGQAEGTVAWRLSEARKKMSEWLKEYRKDVT